uniref:Uncharacterized protein n=1 Tax=Pristionchus pacificus TaxID=54126 RepID=A0A2A6CRF8_PRIPA|eukprot:PDM80678.1 hypothetical protein PRIPAC_35681 [Pristionchus pacificus]
MRYVIKKLTWKWATLHLYVQQYSPNVKVTVFSSSLSMGREEASTYAIKKSFVIFNMIGVSDSNTRNHLGYRGDSV